MDDEDGRLDDKPSVWPFLVLTAIYTLTSVVFCLFYSDKFKDLNADGWGDFLSGVFSPMAFLWLLYAALAQRAELQLQRKEIREGNKTQRQQQEQLERQANSLDAQTSRLAGQANATFQPVLFLTTSAQVENGVQIYIKNLGASVLDVIGIEKIIVQSVVRQDGGLLYNVRGSVVPYWEKDFSLICLIPKEWMGADENLEGMIFRIQITRLDLEKRVYSVKLLMNQQRLLMENIEEVP
jgi:hypothetical protein